MIIIICCVRYLENGIATVVYPNSLSMTPCYNNFILKCIYNKNTSKYYIMRYLLRNNLKFLDYLVIFLYTNLSTPLFDQAVQMIVLKLIMIIWVLRITMILFSIRYKVIGLIYFTKIINIMYRIQNFLYHCSLHETLLIATFKVINYIELSVSTMA